MATRYQYTTKTTDKDNNFRKQDTTIYPKTEPSEDDTFITSNIGDRLDLLAFKYYGDATLWWVIANANQVGKGTLNIKPGTRLRIPQNLDTVYSFLRIVNKSR